MSATMANVRRRALGFTECETSGAPAAAATVAERTDAGVWASAGLETAQLAEAGDTDGMRDVCEVGREGFGPAS